MNNQEIINLIKLLSNNFTKIININVINNYEIIKLSNNGIGNRWCHHLFDYTVFYKNKKYKSYIHNKEELIIDNNIINNFYNELNINKKGNSIVGIFVHRLNNIKNNNRNIRKDIKDNLKNKKCVICGTSSDIIIDHKNDLYNDERVLNIETQTINDFQPLCNHCNLLKRQKHKEEILNKKIFSAKELPLFQIYNYNFPWEYKTYDEYDINLKKDTYFYDPIEFMKILYKYDHYIIPIIKEIKLYILKNKNILNILNKN